MKTNEAYGRIRGLSQTRVDSNGLWLTNITEHLTREGKVYYEVVLDAFSRRVVR